MSYNISSSTSMGISILTSMSISSESRGATITLYRYLREKDSLFDFSSFSSLSIEEGDSGKEVSYPEGVQLRRTPKGGLISPVVQIQGKDIKYRPAFSDRVTSPNKQQTIQHFSKSASQEESLSGDEGVSGRSKQVQLATISEVKQKLQEARASHDEGYYRDAYAKYLELTEMDELPEEDQHLVNDAYYAMGCLLQEGRISLGLKKKKLDQKMSSYFRQAAKNGHIDSLEKMTKLYVHKIRSKKDDKHAIKWATRWHEAALQDPEPAHYLSNIYRFSKDKKIKSEAIAEHWSDVAKGILLSSDQ